nr:response regulator transcription factor [Allobranchiibius huperziae]
MGSILGMADTPRTLKVLLYSDDIATRDAVRIGVGKRPAKDVQIGSWRECATAAAVIEAADNEDLDLLILDGEATPVGGMGLSKQLKNEIFDCPPIIVLTGRPSDGWLASWSQADAAVPHPIDPLILSSTIAEVARRHSDREQLAAPTGQ